MISSTALLSQLQLAHQQASRGLAQVVLITGDAGLGKTHLIHQFQQQLAPSIVGFHLQWFPCDTPHTFSKRLFMEWTVTMDRYYESVSQRLLTLAGTLGLSWQAAQLANELDALMKVPANQSRAEASHHIRQNLPWLKKLNPNLKNQADSLVEGLVDPWLTIAFQAKQRWPSIINLLSDQPQLLARQLIDECLWMHRQLDGHKTAIALWVDQLDSMSVATHKQTSYLWLKTIVHAVSQAESLQVLLGLSCRSEALSRLLTPDIYPYCHHTLLLGPYQETDAQAVMSTVLQHSHKSVEADFWPAVENITQKNVVWLRWLTHALKERPGLWESLETWSASGLERLGIVSHDILIDWVLLPLQLNPDVQLIQQRHPNCLPELLTCLLSEVSPFEAPQILACLTVPPEDGFTLLKVLFSLGLVVPETKEPDHTSSPQLRYQCESRLMLETLLHRLTSMGPLVTVERQQTSLKSVLEPAILSGDLDISQLQELAQLCLSLPNAEALKTDLLRYCGAGLTSQLPRVRLSAMTALAIMQLLHWPELLPLLQDTHSTVRLEAWRYAISIHPIGVDDDTLCLCFTTALSDTLPEVRASALRCIQQSANRLRKLMDLPAIVLSSIQDSNAWVRLQALHLCNVLPDEALPTGALLACGDETDPAVRTALLNQWQRLNPTTTVPLVLTDIEREADPVIRSKLLAFIRQVPLSGLETLLYNGLTQTQHPELIWTLVNKLKKEVQDPDMRERLLTELPTETWPQWLPIAIEH